mmetsp:Transcript_14293/g.19923  ORF Transcript_14293/g.19923 Transcript_14293/m.19923 type:complete len:279 (+) Transcript_14293:65-901(+)
MRSFSSKLNLKQHNIKLIPSIRFFFSIRKPNMSIVVRKSNERGHADHGWLNTYHTFSFADYYDPQFEGCGTLRVLNEDRVSPGEGFGKHPHNNFEIFSYVVSGALRHKDSMGNLESIKRGDIQFTTAGSGITHSEFNDSDSEEVHFLQLWVFPNARGLKPGYQTKHFDDEQKKGALVKVVSPVSDPSTNEIKINQDFSMYASILSQGQKVAHTFGTQRKGYLHLVMNKTGASVNVVGKSGTQVTLTEGDGAFIKGEESVEIHGNGGTAEFVLCDLALT